MIILFYLVDKEEREAQAPSRGQDDLASNSVSESTGNAFQIASAGGSGLIGLRDRVEALGGRLAIASSAGKGTSITVELPTAFT